MNKELFLAQELNCAQHSLAIWGKIAPELFAFDQEEKRHG